MEILIIVFIAIVYVAFQMGKSNKEKEYEEERDQERITKLNKIISDSLQGYYRIASSKQLSIVEYLVEYLEKQAVEFEHRIIDEEEGVLEEHVLYIKTMNQEAEIKIREYVKAWIDRNKSNELIIWYIPTNEEFVNYKEVRGFLEISGALIAKEMFRRFLSIESFIVKTNVDSGGCEWIQWDVAVDSKNDIEELRELYNSNFDDWIKKLHKLDPNVRKAKK